MEHQALGIVKVLPYGDQAVLIQFEDQMDPAIRAQVLATQLALEANELAGIEAYIPGMTSLVVHFSPQTLTHQAVMQHIKELQPLAAAELIPKHKWRIPVCYGGGFGPDLQTLAAWHGMQPEALVELHGKHTYTVYMLGFMPGFGYMGHVSTDRPTPRRKQPRAIVPEGAVALAGHQTCIYPSENAGGWQWIGRTPISLIRDRPDSPFLLHTGDEVQFFEITEEAWHDWRTRILTPDFSWEMLKA